jgi:hypothetical protein
MTMTLQRHLLAAAFSLALTSMPLAAQVAGPTDAPPASRPASKQSETPPASSPPSSSLDDLLKIDQEKPDASKPAADSAQDAAADAARRELDKELSEAEVANAFVQAVEQMGVAASLLDAKFDTGLGTQRVQEDIIAKLSQLLDQAKKNKSSSSSSSSSSSRRQQNKQQQNPGQRQNQQNQNQQQGDQRNNNPSDNRSEIEPPAPQDANANAPLEESRAEWGNLPQRVRDMLLQGRKEKFSTLYEQLTYEYYKRLAEEGSP